MKELPRKPRFPWWLAALLVIVAGAAIGAGYWFYTTQNDGVRRSAEDQLLAVAQLKVSEIATWRMERLGDASSVTGNQLLADELGRWLETRDPAEAEPILSWLETYRVNYGYSDALLVDTEGAVLLNLDPDHAVLAPVALEALALAFAEHRSVLTDLHLSSDGDTEHLDAIAPLFMSADGGQGADGVGGAATANVPIGAVVLSANAEGFLYPLIESWPTTTESGETLLVRREGDHIVYLNELRYQPDAALKYTVPLARTDVPAVQAVLGVSGVVEGLDYRGVEVFAALAAVPDSPWFLVAKMDKSEALAGAGLRSGLTLAVIAILVFAMLVGVWANWQLRQKRHFQEAYETEAARRTLLTRFEHLVQQANDAIILGAVDGKILEANERALALYGYTREEIAQLSMADLVPPEESDKLAQRMSDLHEGRSLLQEATHLRKDGSRVPVEVSSALIDEEGSLYAQAIVRDITERKKNEEERLQFERHLQQTQRLESLGVMAGGIAHDFNNILMAVLGHADLALADLPSTSPVRENLHEIVQASRKAAELSRQMLAYSGRGQFAIEAIDLGALINDIVGLLRTSFSKKILLNLNLAKNLPPVRGDAGQLSQVIMNLVINGAEAIGDRSGVVTISTGAMECTTEYLEETYLREDLVEGLYITLEVSDTGCGIAREAQTRLFEPFYTTKFAGRGLGLSAVLGIVRGHKGALKVYSELNKGTTFKILLPAVEDGGPPLGLGGANPRESWRSTGTVLLVDDEETIRALGQRMLERLGFTVLTAADGFDAVELYRAHRSEIVIVLLDLTMPRMNGEEAFRELRRLDPDVRVIISSGYTDTDISPRFAGKGLAGFLQKPYALDSLRERLRDALGEPPEETPSAV